MAEQLCNNAVVSQYFDPPPPRGDSRWILTLAMSHGNVGEVKPHKEQTVKAGYEASPRGFD